MDQITQDQLDPEIAQEVIVLLNKKIANLRGENAQLQVWPTRMDHPNDIRKTAILLFLLEKPEKAEIGGKKHRKHRS